jgi:hypothetical protein
VEENIKDEMKSRMSPATSGRPRKYGNRWRETLESSTYRFHTEEPMSERER